MLIRLMPNQISERWPAIGQAIAQSFQYDPFGPPNLNKTLEQAIAGKLQVWISVDENKTIGGVVSTCFVPDVPEDSYSVLVYSLWGSRENGKRNEWLEGIDTLKKFAQDHGATGIVFYTCNPSVATFIEHLGKAVKKSFYRIEAADVSLHKIV